MHTGGESEWYLKLRYGGRRRINPVARLLEPSGNLGEVEWFEFTRVEGRQPNASPLGTPYSEARWWNNERPAIGIQGKKGLITLFFNIQRD